MVYEEIWQSGEFMDKISLLQSRRQQLIEAGKNVRADICSLIDKDSFVELSCYSFSKNEYYGEDAQGEGVVTGFATIGDYPFYIVAQNAAVLSGGISKANCEKIEKCLNQAEKSSTPVIWLLSSLGVQLGEGVGALEGLAALILKSSQLKGSVPQYLIVNGEVYGQLAVLAGICDFTYFVDKKSALAPSSPLVISAKSGVNLSKFDIGGADALKNANIATFTVKDLGEIKNSIAAINEIITRSVIDGGELNACVAELDAKADRENLLKIFDENTVIELGSGYSPEIGCYLARVGGIAVAVGAEGMIVHEIPRDGARAVEGGKAEDELQVVDLYPVDHADDDEILDLPHKEGKVDAKHAFEGSDAVEPRRFIHRLWDRLKS